MAEAMPILFTAFETSGDALAARVIAQLRQWQPQRPIFAMGGPRMREAGAELLEETTGKAVMLAGAITQAQVHRKRLKQLRDWLAQHRIAALVPVDSPAANWSVCSLVRRMQPHARIAHLVAPQLWAWAPWRIGKLRRLTDRVLCVLPFEVDYMQSRQVPAVFVGHPLFDPPPTFQTPEELPDDLPRGTAPKLALLPGSRASEIRRNWPMMLETTRLLRRHDGRLEAIAAASSEANARLIQSLMPTLQRPVPVLIERVDDILQWCDVALVVSGTATLHVAAHRKPMVAVFNASRLGWWAARWMIQTRTFTLPNLISESMNMGRIMPEFVPHFGQIAPIENALARLMREEKARQKQIDAFEKIAERFAQPRFSEAAPQTILDVIEADD